jgi:hypothetical protein
MNNTSSAGPGGAASRKLSGICAALILSNIAATTAVSPGWQDTSDFDLFEYPSAILCGESVLHAAGWITQIPRQLSVAVLSRPSYVSLHGFDIRGRPLSWFRRIHLLVDPSVEKRVYGLRALTPAVALADLYGDPKAWHPDPDDLDIPDEDHDAVLSAFELFGVSPLTRYASTLKR